jgi:acyl-CoA thioester hydrolase
VWVGFFRQPHTRNSAPQYAKIICVSAKPHDKKAGHSAAQFYWPCRVYYEDTDFSGVVYHANYLRFFERARTEWLRALGFDGSSLKATHGIVLTVHRMEIDFLRAARMDDALTLSVELLAAKRVSFDLNQIATRGDELIASARVKVACVSSDSFKPAPIPSSFLEKLRA